MTTNFDAIEAARQRKADLDFARGEVPPWILIVMAVLCFLCIGSVSLFIGSVRLWSQMRTEAIERGYATHDPKTGEWQWVEPLPKTNAGAIP